MRRLTLLLATVTVLLAACATGDDEPAAGPRRSASSGKIEVTAQPVTVSTESATFRLVFDTHAGSLDFEPTEIVTLRMAGASLPASTWEGPGPGGHHRDGTVTFDAGGLLEDLALEVALDPPVTLTWEE